MRSIAGHVMLRRATRRSMKRGVDKGPLRTSSTTGHGFDTNTHLLPDAVNREPESEVVSGYE